MNDRFVEASKRERYCLNIIFNKILKYNNKHNLYLTSEYDYDRQDATLYIYKEHICVKGYIIECKLRKNNYDTYFYESKKHKSLTKLKKEYSMGTNVPFSILYVNVTPSKTYIWDIDKILPETNKVKVACNKESMSGDNIKIDKGVYELHINNSKHLEFTFNELEYQYSIKPTSLKEDASKPKGIQF